MGGRSCTEPNGKKKIHEEYTSNEDSSAAAIES